MITITLRNIWFYLFIFRRATRLKKFRFPRQFIAEKILRHEIKYARIIERTDLSHSITRRLPSRIVLFKNFFFKQMFKIILFFKNVFLILFNRGEGDIPITFYTITWFTWLIMNI